jgi:hypothetical protein
MMKPVRCILAVSGGVVALLAAVHLFGGEEGNMSAESKRIVRKATGGGHWFPAIQRDLDAAVSGAIQSAKVPKIEGRIVAAMAPHAGYEYSGTVAGYTFRAIQDNAAGTNKPEPVVVLGFTHSLAFEGVALATEPLSSDSIVTPGGVNTARIWYSPR